MKVLIIGGVAAGTKAAAKLKREDRSLDITILTRDRDISYAGCGLPYYVGGLIESRDQLIVNTPEKYAALTGVQVRTGREAVGLKAAEKKVEVRNLEDGEVTEEAYDKLIIAAGASSIMPEMEGIHLQGVFKLRTPDDAIFMRNYLKDAEAKKAVVVGGGFIGLETAENLKEQGLDVTVLDAAPQIVPGVLDPEMAAYAKKHLQKQGIRVITGVKVEALLGDSRVTAVRSSAGTFPADLAVMSVGVRPNTAWLADSGLEMVKGALVVDRQMKTNLEDVYAVGDCVMVTNRVTGKPQWSPMGSSANLEGRMLAQVLAGEQKSYPGVLGTGVVKLPGLNCGRTGLTEAAAREAGYEVETALAVTDDKAHYYPGAASFATKLIADKKTHKLLGIQVFGPGAVDKMVDIAVAGISMGAVLEDFEAMDFAYAPPFSTAIHPFVQAVYILENKINGVMDSMTPAEYAAGAAEDYRIIDVAPAPQIPGATHVQLEKVDGPVEGLGKDEKLLLVCLKGKRGYFLQNRLKALGYTNTKVLEGATFFNDVKVKGVKSAVSPEEITRLKGLGFLRDKNTPDCFNARVITRNGKVTADEMAVITEAARRFGSGEVTMTTRLTMEIQKIPYDKIEDFLAFMKDAGMETGGTGSKVRPVVSCKGTTCQYGLIDTFELSEEIHQLFYKGYREVKLPHKFKIAVGGCPNNCLKPDLNDVGIVGQRLPVVDLEKCRGCKVCQMEKNCPIHVAHLEDGKVVIDPAACNHCGRCVGKCPFHAADQYVNGYKVYLGGRWGKRSAQGQAMDHMFTGEEEVLALVEKAILLFKDQGTAGERFADTIARLGFEQVQALLLGDDLLQRKAEILADA